MRSTRAGVTQCYRVSVSDTVSMGHVVLVGQVMRVVSTVVSRGTTMGVVVIQVSGVSTVGVPCADVTCVVSVTSIGGIDSAIVVVVVVQVRGCCVTRGVTNKSELYVIGAGLNFEGVGFISVNVLTSGETLVTVAGPMRVGVRVVPVKVS